MTEGGRRDDGRVSLWVRLSQAVAIGTGMALLGTMACDTVARIPTEDRTFRNLHPVTISPHDAGETGCGAIDGNEGGVLSMVFLDNDGRPIKPGQDVERGSVELTSDDVSFDGGRLYAFPDVECPDSSICPGTISCSEVSGGAMRCSESTGVFTRGTPEFVGAEPASQAFGVAMADVGRWGGRYHADFNGLFEFNEDGENRELDQPRDDTVAVDLGGHRINALRDLANEWGRLSDYVVEDEREAYFGYWLFGGPSEEVSSQLAGGAWTQDPSTATNAISNHAFREGRAGVYNSLIRIIQDAYGSDPVVSEVEEKHLLFLVAGYDERRDSTVDEVIAAAISNGVSVSVVQVDAEIPEPAHLRDDLRYYREQYGSPCSSDDECANYEVCREPVRYANSRHTDDPQDVVWPESDFHTDGDHYCLPGYDENGRVGPIEEYKRLACETGGSYSYVTDVGRAVIAQPMVSQLWAPEAAWAVEIGIGEHPAETVTGESYLLETTLNVNIGRNQSYRFDRGSSSDPDTREVFFAP